MGLLLVGCAGPDADDDAAVGRIDVRDEGGSVCADGVCLVDFGGVVVGVEARHRVILANVGDGDVSVDVGIDSDVSGFATDGVVGAIAPGFAATIDVVYLAAAAGPATAVLHIDGGSAGGEVLDVVVRANAAVCDPAPSLRIANINEVAVPQNATVHVFDDVQLAVDAAACAGPFSVDVQLLSWPDDGGALDGLRFTSPGTGPHTIGGRATFGARVVDLPPLTIEVVPLETLSVSAVGDVSLHALFASTDWCSANHCSAGNCDLTWGRLGAPTLVGASFVLEGPLPGRYLFAVAAAAPAVANLQAFAGGQLAAEAVVDVVGPRTIYVVDVDDLGSIRVVDASDDLGAVAACF